MVSYLYIKVGGKKQTNLPKVHFHLPPHIFWDNNGCPDPTRHPRALTNAKGKSEGACKPQSATAAALQPGLWAAQPLMLQRPAWVLPAHSTHLVNC